MQQVLTSIKKLLLPPLSSVRTVLTLTSDQTEKKEKGDSQLIRVRQVFKPPGDATRLKNFLRR
jgi:hypothetical protein